VILAWAPRDAYVSAGGKTVGVAVLVHPAWEAEISGKVGNGIGVTPVCRRRGIRPARLLEG
jgi:hypothetical protein